MRFLDLIVKKRGGLSHTPEEIRFIALSAAKGSVPDYQLSAWLMAVVLNGMDTAETVAMTREMLASGSRLSLKGFGRPKVDKHSTGGVGDGVSIALAPLAAAAGLVVPMMSGRGLGHTGGTLDKLEAIRGFKVDQPEAAIKRQLKSLGVCMFGQTADLAPADRKLYHLRDATGTVESLPLIVSSILSKKLAEDLDALVLDVKTGSGAFFGDFDRAHEGAEALVAVARGLGLKAAAVITSMDQPMGKYVGNGLEVRQAVEVLQGVTTAPDYVECLLVLGGWMLKLGRLARTPDEGRDLCEQLIRSGAALDRFRDMVAAQGGDPRVADEPDRLPKAAKTLTVQAPVSGFVTRLDARGVGIAGLLLGAGRTKMEDRLDYGAGIVLEKKLGDRVRKGETAAVLHGRDARCLNEARKKYLEALAIGARAPRIPPIVRKILCPAG
ncbi:MAG: thymidine phosphorylase [Elusimicrobia bacterium]|nr:thymidine phosphorylase [Elusimicrobiota bacterium]